MVHPIGPRRASRCRCCASRWLSSNHSIWLGLSFLWPLVQPVRCRIVSRIRDLGEYIWLTLWLPQAFERRRAFASEIIKYRVVRQRPPLSFGWCLLIVSVAAAFGREMPVVLVGLTIIDAAALRERLSGRPF
jgi:hypothetical protein